MKIKDMEKQALNLINLYNERGQRHGYWEDYWSGGQLLRKGRYVNGKRDGYWEVYHPSGQLHMKGHFVNGEFIKEKEQTELTMDEIAAKFGIPVNQLKIKK